MSGEISSWNKAKDAALITFVGIASAGVMKLMVDVAELKKDLAVYQANLHTLKEDHDRLRSEVAAHNRADRELFSELGLRRR